MTEELTFSFKSNLAIKYRFKPGAKDCKHLLIVMSGFNIPDPTIYDFNVLNHCHSNILWIRDDFNGLPAYYLCNGMNFNIEQGVSLLIKGVIDFVKPAMVSILGGSKGGSMALYYGMKHGFTNIITSVPQFRIGSYVAEGYWHEVGKQMMGTVSENNIRLLDRYLPDIINKDAKIDKNIYLFTSPKDKQYPVEIQPNLPLFDKYANFNLIESRSSLFQEHNQITGYNLNLILSIIYQLENNIRPKLGHVRNGDEW